jgi:hypothetical protein
MDGLAKIADRIIERIKTEWILSGHPLTGSFEESLEGIPEYEGDIITLNIWGNEYGIYVDQGVSAERIPYTRRNRGEGSGGTSKYITGLKNYGILRLGLDERAALSFAFAVAEKHSTFGMPGSGFLERVRETEDAELDRLVSDHLDKEIEKLL